MFPDEKRGRLPIELFADLGTDIDPCLAADTDTLGVAEHMLHRPARQILGQRPASMRRVVFLFLGGGCCCRVRDYRGVRAAWLGAVFREQERLMGIEAFALLAVQPL